MASDSQCDPFLVQRHKSDLNFLPWSYVKEWKLIFTEEQIEKAVEDCAIDLKEKFKNCDKEIVIVAILNGAVYFLVDLTRELDAIGAFPNGHTISTLKVSLYGQNFEKTESSAIDLSDKAREFIDKQVILIDEFFDSGVTINAVKTELENKMNLFSEGRPQNPVYVVTLMTRLREQYNSRLADLSPLVVITTDWLVGYGLDYQGKCRNWKCIYSCKPVINQEEQSQDDNEKEYWKRLEEATKNDKPFCQNYRHILNNILDSSTEEKRKEIMEIASYALDKALAAVPE